MTFTVFQFLAGLEQLLPQEQDVLFMQLLVLLRRSGLMEGATDNDAKLNQPMA